MKIKMFCIVLSIFVFYEVNSQIITNVKAELQGEKVLITYDLQSTDNNITYFVQIFCSHDNYSTPLKYVTGNVFGGVKPQKGEIVVWDYIKENLPDEGNVDFKVIAKEEKREDDKREQIQTDNIKKDKPTLNYDYKFLKNSLNQEIMMSGTLLSINYERTLLKTNHFHLSGQLGIGWVPGGDRLNEDFSVPFAVSSYFGGKYSFLVSRIGYNFFSYEGDSTDINDSYLTLLVGYKYQKRFIFKALAGITSNVYKETSPYASYYFESTETNIYPWGGISLGIAF